MWTLGFFGLIAILIAAVGLYGILAHGVAQLAHELGIRMALGADLVVTSVRSCYVRAS